MAGSRLYMCTLKPVMYCTDLPEEGHRGLAGGQELGGDTRVTRDGGEQLPGLHGHTGDRALWVKKMRIEIQFYAIKSFKNNFFYFSKFDLFDNLVPSLAMLQ